MTDRQAQARLRSVRDILEHEGHALAALNDERLDSIVRAIEELEAQIVVSLAMCGEPRERGADGRLPSEPDAFEPLELVLRDERPDSLHDGLRGVPLN